MEALAPAVGALVGLVASYLADRRRRRTEHRLFSRVLARVVTEDRLIEELERDPFVGRDYARPVLTEENA